MGKTTAADKIRMQTLHEQDLGVKSHCPGISWEAVEAQLSADNLPTHAIMATPWDRTISCTNACLTRALLKLTPNSQGDNYRKDGYWMPPGRPQQQQSATGCHCMTAPSNTHNNVIQLSEIETDSLYLLNPRGRILAVVFPLFLLWQPRSVNDFWVRSPYAETEHKLR